MEKVTCYLCNGTGWIVCERCGGQGFLPGFATLAGSTTMCDECMGSGEVECPVCNGTGKIEE